MTTLVPQLTKAEARRRTDEVKRSAAALWAELLALYESGAHTALGYSSWGEYCADEFDMSASRSYQLLNSARVVAVIGREDDPQSTMVERQARELRPLQLEAGDAEMVELWRGLRAEYGEGLTASRIRDAVRERLESEREVAEDEEELLDDGDMSEGDGGHPPPPPPSDLESWGMTQEDWGQAPPASPEPPASAGVCSNLKGREREPCTEPALPGSDKCGKCTAYLALSKYREKSGRHKAWRRKTERVLIEECGWSRPYTDEALEEAYAKAKEVT
jgi:hypothetical protein